MNTSQWSLVSLEAFEVESDKARNESRCQKSVRSRINNTESAMDAVQGKYDKTFSELAAVQQLIESACENRSRLVNQKEAQETKIVNLRDQLQGL